MESLMHLTPEDRQTFQSIADILLPAHGRLPGAAEAGVGGDLLDAVMAHRPDLVPALLRGLRTVRGEAGRAAAELLLKNDGEAFDAIGLAASGAYFMSPTVRERLGYPGQESLRYDVTETAEYERNGMLDKVRARGPVFRDTR